MSYYWLSDGTNTLVIEDTVNEIEFGGIKRDFEVERFVGAHGGIVNGLGNIGERTFSISRKEKAGAGEATAWNSRRENYLKLFLNNYYILRTRIFYCPQRCMGKYQEYKSAFSFPAAPSMIHEGKSNPIF